MFPRCFLILVEIEVRDRSVETDSNLTSAGVMGNRVVCGGAPQCLAVYRGSWGLDSHIAPGTLGAMLWLPAGKNNSLRMFGQSANQFFRVYTWYHLMPLNRKLIQIAFTSFLPCTDNPESKLRDWGHVWMSVRGFTLRQGEKRVICKVERVVTGTYRKNWNPQCCWDKFAAQRMALNLRRPRSMPFCASLNQPDASQRESNSQTICHQMKRT